MPWYAASAIMYLKFKDDNQDIYPVWENVLLVQAETPEQAEEKAYSRARQDEGDGSSTVTWNGRPATWVFAGLRKLIIVSHPDTENKELDCSEVTFSEFEIASQDDFNSYVNGKDVRLLYCED